MYTKQTWVNGETITDTKLNHMEEGIANGGGLYSYSESDEVIFEGNVTTVVYDEEDGYAGGPLEPISVSSALPETLIVEFNGHEYVCEKMEEAGETTVLYGGELGRFTEYPFCIIMTEDGDAHSFFTETAGTYSLKLTAHNEVFEINKAFKNSVGVKTKFIYLDFGRTYTSQDVYGSAEEQFNFEELPNVLAVLPNPGIGIIETPSWYVVGPHSIMIQTTVKVLHDFIGVERSGLTVLYTGEWKEQVSPTPSIVL